MNRSVTARLTNRTTRLIAPVETLAALREHFSYTQPNYQFTDRFRRELESALARRHVRVEGAYSMPKTVYLGKLMQAGRREGVMGEVWNGSRCLMRQGSVPTGLFLAQVEELEKSGFQISLQDLRESPQFCSSFPSNVAAKLREYQEQCVLAMIQASRTGGLVLKATRTGKTFTAAAYFSRLQGNGLFIVDDRTLLVQNQREIADHIGSCGIVGAGEQQPERVTVATVQTLIRRVNDGRLKDWLQSIDVVMVDECHLALNDRTRKVLRYISPKTVFGLTATLELDKPEVRMEAAAMFGPTVFSYGIQKATSEGYLTPGAVLRVMVASHLAGKSYQTQRKNLIQQRERNACTVEIVKAAVAAGRRVILLVQWIEHIYTLHGMLAGIPHYTLYGDVPKEERLAAIQAMDSGKVSLLLASSVFAKGVTIKTVDWIVNATGTKGSNGVIQRYGRGIGLAEDKTRLVFVDIADVGNRFEAAANQRRDALLALGLPMKRMWWTGSAQKVLDAATFD